MKARKGFTLVEILIVVVILGILAAIVIPQFTNASTEAKESSLAADLQTLRSQLELYKIQHGDSLPRTDSFANFETDMTTQGADGYGPYMGKIPTNAFNGLNTVRFDGAAAGANTDGWRLDTTTGIILPDDNTDADGDGVADHTLL